MAGSIKGLTVEIAADTSKFESAFKQADSTIKSTQSQLRELNKALKIDPSSTNLLTDKYKALQVELKASEDKVKALEDIQKQMDAEGIDKNSEAYRNLQNEIDVANAKLKAAQDEVKAFGTVGQQQIKLVGQKISEVGDKIGKVGDGLTKYVSVPLTAIGGASIAAWQEVDEAMDTVAIKTGATGKALEGMQDVAKNLAETLPVSFQEAGDAVGEVNTRFGVTGDKLGELSAQFLKFSSMNGTDVSGSIDSVQKSLAAFNLSADDAGVMLDAMNKAGQDSGVSMDKLADDLVKNATAFQQLGMNAGSSISLLAKLEKSGVDTQTVLQGLARVQKKAADDGVSMSEELEKAFSDAGSASEIMGRSGAKLFAAYEQGQITIDDFTDSTKELSEYAGNVSDTFNETLDPIDQMQAEFNKLKDVGAEVGAVILEDMLPTIERIGDGAKDLAEKWDSLSPKTQDLIVKLGLIAAASGPVLSTTGKLTEGVGKLVGQIGDANTPLMKFVGFLKGPEGIAVAATVAAGAVAVWFDEFSKNNSVIRQSADDVRNATAEISANNESVKDLIARQDDANGKLSTNKALADKLIGTIEDLNKVDKLSVDQKKKMADAVAQLNAIYPDLNVQIDKNTGKTEQSTEAIRQNADALIEQAKAAAAQEQMLETAKALADAQENLAEAQENSKQATEDLNNYLEGNLSYWEQMNAHHDELFANAKNATEEEIKAQEAVDALTKKLQEQGEAAQVTTEATDAHAESVAADAEAADALSESLGYVVTNTNGVVEVFQNASGQIVDASGNLVAATSGDVQIMSEDQANLAAKYQETWEKAQESFSGQIGLFEQLKPEKVTIEDMTEAFKSQIDTLTNYTSNVQIVQNAMSTMSGETAQSAGEFLQAVSGMGIQGAGYLQALVDVIQRDDGSAAEILADFADAQTAKENWSTAMADMTAQADTMSQSVQESVTGVHEWTQQEAMAAAQSAGDALDTIGERGKTAADNGMNEYNGTITGYAADSQAAGETNAQATETGLKSVNFGVVGTQNVSDYSKGVKAANKLALDAATAIGTTVQQTLLSFSRQATDWGKGLGSNFASGITSQISAVATAAGKLASAAAAPLHHSTPDIGALKDDDKWGAEMVANFAASMREMIPAVQSASMMVAQAAAFSPQAGAYNGIGVAANGISAAGVSPSAIYEAVRQGASDANVTVIMGEREVSRSLRDMGVAFGG